MKNIKVVIGSNFGDEGKGLFVDYFCNKFSSLNENVLNVRFSGGAQCGHTVVTPLSDRHIFRHFGAGSFNKNVSTYLSSFFIVNPILFRKEINELKSIGINPKVYIDESCRITFPFDMMINQIVEKYRNNNRHGSCGVGVFETVKRNESMINFYVKDCFNNPNLQEFYKICIETYVVNRLKELGVNNILDDDMRLLRDNNIFYHYLDDIKFLFENSTIVKSNIIDNYNNIIFEGSQGLLLDQLNIEYFPNLTPSSTGLRNVISILNSLNKISDVEVCYVTRSYFTRHGAGKFLSECQKSNINENMIDKTNGYNEFQHDLRYGYFDLNLFSNTMFKDWKLSENINKNYNIKNSIAITHLDETNNYLFCNNEKLSVEKFKNIIGNIPIYQSIGETRNNIVYN